MQLNRNKKFFFYLTAFCHNLRMGIYFVHDLHAIDRFNLISCFLILSLLLVCLSCNGIVVVFYLFVF